MMVGEIKGSETLEITCLLILSTKYSAYADSSVVCLRQPRGWEAGRGGLLCCCSQTAGLSSVCWSVGVFRGGWDGVRQTVGEGWLWRARWEGTGGAGLSQTQEGERKCLDRVADPELGP